MTSLPRPPHVTSLLSLPELATHPEQDKVQQDSSAQLSQHIGAADPSHCRGTWESNHFGAFFSVFILAPNYAKPASQPRCLWESAVGLRAELAGESCWALEKQLFCIDRHEL